MNQTQKEADRLFARVHRTEGCWYWTGYVNPATGYGQAHLRGRGHPAHRAIYMVVRGEIPVGFQVDHLCHDASCTESLNCPHRTCVNPDHLRLATGRANTLRGNTITGINAAKTHCKHGHEFTPENTYPYNGKRFCRACRSATKRAWNAARRAA